MNTNHQACVAIARRADELERGFWQALGVALNVSIPGQVEDTDEVLLAHQALLDWVTYLDQATADVCLLGGLDSPLWTFAWVQRILGAMKGQQECLSWIVSVRERRAGPSPVGGSASPGPSMVTLGADARLDNALSPGMWPRWPVVMEWASIKYEHNGVAWAGWLDMFKDGLDRATP